MKNKKAAGNGATRIAFGDELILPLGNSAFGENVLWFGFQCRITTSVGMMDYRLLRFKLTHFSLYRYIYLFLYRYITFIDLTIFLLPRHPLDRSRLTKRLELKISS